MCATFTCFTFLHHQVLFLRTHFAEVFIKSIPQQRNIYSALQKYIWALQVATLKNDNKDGEERLASQKRLVKQLEGYVANGRKKMK